MFWRKSKMNKKILILMIGIFILIPFITAESIGVFKQNQETQITNYCSTSDCTYANITRIILPNGTINTINEEMTQTGYNFNYSYTPTELGTYKFSSCSNPSGVNVCEEDRFEVTPTGSPQESIQLWTRIFLILFSLSVIIFIQVQSNRMNYDQWYSKMHQKWESKNTIKWAFSALGYNLMKNSYFLSYLVGLVGLLILTETTVFFNITSAIDIMKIVLGIYSWSAIVVTLIFFSQVQEWFTQWIKDIQNIKWGFEK
jgi:hypothetical protein